MTTFESKFGNRELLRQALKGSPDPVTALVELDLPARQIEFVEQRYAGEQFKFKGIAPLTADEEKEIIQKTNEMKEFLRSVTGTDPLWLQSAHAFVVDTTGEQLGAIANFPLTKAIHPNRALR